MTHLHTIPVKLGNKSYKIFIDEKFPFKLSSLIPKSHTYSKVFIITDKNVNNEFKIELDKLKKKFVYEKIVLPEGEKTKSFKYLEIILDKLLSKRIDRNALLVCMGGGVIGDLTGLIASITLRGIDFIQVPTTLLSQVDSSVGGKTAINSKYGKNLIGTFNQPRVVLISLSFLKKLPKRQLISGYAEILKYSLIKSKPFFDWLNVNGKKIINLNVQACSKAIKESCKIKSQIVSNDEKEKGVREILNFGHTFGHALESLTGYSKKLNHGESIILGMYIAIKFSVFLGFCNKEIIKKYERHLENLNIKYKIHDYKIKISPTLFIIHLRFDKKIKNKKIKFILLNDIGRVKTYFLDNEKLLFNFIKNEILK